MLDALVVTTGKSSSPRLSRYATCSDTSQIKIVRGDYLSMDHRLNNVGSIRTKALVVVLIAAVGSGALFYGSGIGTEPARTAILQPPDNHARKPVQTMN